MKKSSFVDWVSVVLDYPHGGSTEMTFEYEDDFVSQRQRYYCLTDVEYLLLQLAMSAVVLNYGDSNVGKVDVGNGSQYITGDEYIELLSLLHSMRKGNGDTFVPSDKVFDEIIKIIKEFKKTAELPECDLTDKDDIAKFYWTAAISRIITGLTKMKKIAGKSL